MLEFLYATRFVFITEHSKVFTSLHFHCDNDSQTSKVIVPWALVLVPQGRHQEYARNIHLSSDMSIWNLPLRWWYKIYIYIFASICFWTLFYLGFSKSVPCEDTISIYVSLWWRSLMASEVLRAKTQHMSCCHIYSMTVKMIYSRQLFDGCLTLTSS